MPSCNRCYQLTIMQIRARWSKSEMNKRCCSRLSSVFIHPARMPLSIHKFWQIVSVDQEPSQCQQTIGEFVLITRIGKQHSPISIVHRFPANALGDRHNAITSYSTILHNRHFLPRVHVMGSCSAWFRSAIWLAPQNFEVMVDRKCTETLPGPFTIFWPGNEASTIEHNHQTSGRESPISRV